MNHTFHTFALIAICGCLLAGAVPARGGTFNVHGLQFGTAHHATRFGRVGAYRNTHHVTVTGKHGFRIEQLNTERNARCERANFSIDSGKDASGI